MKQRGLTSKVEVFVFVHGGTQAALLGPILGDDRVVQTRDVPDVKERVSMTMMVGYDHISLTNCLKQSIDSIHVDRCIECIICRKICALVRHVFRTCGIVNPLIFC